MTRAPSSRQLLPPQLIVGATAFIVGCATAALADRGYRAAAAAALGIASLVLLAWLVMAFRRRSPVDGVGLPVLPLPQLRRLEGFDALGEVNRMSSGGESSFRVIAEENGRLVFMGGFDLDYYHDVEVAFHDVIGSTCPQELRWPRFTDSGPVGERRRFVVEDDLGRYEVVARTVSAETGKVFHYRPDRPLRPGERTWAT